MAGALEVASWAVGNIIEPMLTEEIKKRIKELLGQGPWQQLATWTYSAACKAQNELGWSVDEDALGQIVILVRKSKGSISWDMWERIVLPVVFPKLVMNENALHSWHSLVADILNSEFKDKYLMEYVIEIRSTVDEIKRIVSQERSFPPQIRAIHLPQPNAHFTG